MASPQEILELAIPHPSDSTPESRRRSAQSVIQAMQVNDYYFVRRQSPIQERDDGQCPTCKCDLVHIMHGAAFETAEQRIEWQRKRLEKVEAALQSLIANPTLEAAKVAAAALY